MASWLQWIRAAFATGKSAKRRLQAHLDVHRLVLYTSAYEQLAKGVQIDEAALQSLTQAADGLSLEVLDARLQASLHAQLRTIADAVHEAVSAVPPVPPAPPPQLPPNSPPQRRSGLSYAVDSRPPIAAHNAVQHALQDAFRRAMGFCLEVAPSAVGHRSAGDGVWLRGAAKPGQVVALYPGLVYPPTELRNIPGYPTVSRDNDYLFARQDGSIIDAKPWGVGPGPPGTPWPLLPEPGTTTVAQWANLAEQQALQQLQWEQLAELCEARHPLARGHLINHPGKGTAPNVLQASFTIPHTSDLDAWRRYLPNCTSTPAHAGQEQEGPVPEAAPVLGLALVAIQPLKDEELLLNYRLSTHVRRPSWYHPVDADEDARRWA